MVVLVDHKGVKIQKLNSSFSGDNISASDGDLYGGGKVKTKLIRRTLVKEFDDCFFFFNTFTNVTFEAKREENISVQEYIEQNQDVLVENGVLCVSDEAYYEMMDFFYYRDANNTKSIAITDALSFDCNLRCVYCMQQNTPNVAVKLSPEERILLWKNILEILNAEELSVCLFGFSFVTIRTHFNCW